MKTKHPSVDAPDSRAIWSTPSKKAGSNSLTSRPKNQPKDQPKNPPTRQKRSDPSALTAVTKSDAQRTETTGATEHIDYNGHTLRVESQRKGWRVVIFPKNSPFALHRTPCTFEFTERDAVIAEAKAIVDEIGVKKISSEAARAKSTSPEAAKESIAPPKSARRNSVPFFLRVQRRSMQWCGKALSAVKRAYFSVDTRSN